eukprot:TRINITY_DN10554_c0_g1_i2.p1 TRINITY_DN10554_c0_g1~~TRINITY_DN10554_c0_g1_i2.p1  ORF type:complete len:275 (-),score=40.03 TRINITY_DN10554_c0_g1_i2:121-945(-)
MESDGEMSPRLATPAAKQRGRSTSSMLAETIHVQFALGAAEVKEFVAKKIRVEASQVGTGDEDANIEDDSPRVYKMALRERLRRARHQTVPVNEARALRRASRLSSSLETCDEKHLGFSPERLAYLREFCAETRATRRTLDLHRPRGEVDLSWENDEILVTDVAKGQTAASSVHDVEPGSSGWMGSAVEGGPSNECTKKSKIGVVWHSLSTSCSRAAQLTTKGLSNVRKKTWFRDASSKDASHSRTKGLRFARWQKRDNVCTHSFAAVVPHQEA